MHVGIDSRRNTLQVGAVLAALKVLVHLPWLARYGFHRDELYFIECAEHLAFGYVDHPPMIAWVARLAAAPFGYHIVALRLPAVLAGAATVFLTVLLVRELGGKRWAQVIAGLCVIAAPVFLRTNAMHCIPAFEPLFWTAGAYLLARIARGASPRLWLLVGVVAGLGLLNKHSMLLFGAGAAVGLLATPLRTHLRTRWPWIGLVIAALVFLPNVIWQATHDWATLEFLRTMSATTLAGVPRHLFLAGQLVYVHPFTIPVWAAGLVFLFSVEGRRFRVLGWIFVVSLVVLLVNHGKPYYLAPAFPALFAAGGVFWEARASRAWRVAAPALLVVGLVIISPLGLPIAPLPSVDAGVDRVLGDALPPMALTYTMHDEFGWREQVDAVASVHRMLDEDAVILTGNYGEAAAIARFGPDRGLPRAISGNMSYYLWGPGDVDEATPVIAYGLPRTTLERLFGDVREAARFEHPLAMEREGNLPIYICRAPRRPLAEAWPSLRAYGHAPGMIARRISSARRSPSRSDEPQACASAARATRCSRASRRPHPQPMQHRHAARARDAIRTP